MQTIRFIETAMVMSCVAAFAWSCGQAKFANKNSDDKPVAIQSEPPVDSAFVGDPNDPPLPGDPSINPSDPNQSAEPTDQSAPPVSPTSPTPSVPSGPTAPVVGPVGPDGLYPSFQIDIQPRVAPIHPFPGSGILFTGYCTNMGPHQIVWNLGGFEMVGPQVQYSFIYVGTYQITATCIGQSGTSLVAQDLVQIYNPDTSVPQNPGVCLPVGKSPTQSPSQAPVAICQ